MEQTRYEIHSIPGDPYLNLAAAVIRQACIDFVQACRGHKPPWIVYTIEQDVRRLCTEWTSIDPEWMVRKLRAMKGGHYAGFYKWGDGVHAGKL